MPSTYENIKQSLRNNGFGDRGQLKRSNGSISEPMTIDLAATEIYLDLLKELPSTRDTKTISEINKEAADQELNLKFSLPELAKFTGKYIVLPAATIAAGGYAMPFLAPGTIGGNLIGTTAGGLAASNVANTIYKDISGSNNGYMSDAFNWIGGNKIENPLLRDIAEFGFNLADPAFYGNVAGSAYNKLSKTASEALNTILMANNVRRFKRDLNRVIKETPLYNQNVEHVSQYGITLGSQMIPYSTSDVGIHLSLPNAKATKNIQAFSEEPTTVRLGVLTFSPNITTPNVESDLGLWTSQVNPELYVNRPWRYEVLLNNANAQDALRLSETTPIISYRNSHEGENEISLMLTDPNYLLLSKNLIAETPTESGVYTHDHFGLRNSEGFYLNGSGISLQWPELVETLARFRKDANTGDHIGLLPGIGRFRIQESSPNLYNLYFNSYARNNNYGAKENLRLQNVDKNEILKYINGMRKLFDEQRNKYAEQALKDFNLTTSIDLSTTKTWNEVNALRDNTTPEMQKLISETINNDVMDFYNSDEYEKRVRDVFKKMANARNITDPTVIDKAVNSFILNITNQDFIPFAYYANPTNNGVSYANAKMLGFNLLNPVDETHMPSVLGHEFGHILYQNHPSLKAMDNYVYSKIGHPKDNLLPGVDVNEPYVKYLVGTDGKIEGNEFRQRIMEAAYKMYNEGLTIDQMIDRMNTPDMPLARYFTRDYLKKALKYLLTTTGAFTVADQAINNDNNSPVRNFGDK